MIEDKEKFKVSFSEIIKQIRPTLYTIRNDKFLLISTIILVMIPLFIIGAFIASIVIVFGHLF